MAEVVVITGASAGVGRATAVAFARRGAAVALLARGTDGLEGACRDVEQAGGRALPIATDVADHEQVEAAAERVERELGPVDVWVNVAMTAILAEVRNTRPEEFRSVVEVTFLGSVHGAMAALSRMQERDRGTIVQVGSALARRGIPLQATYCGAKHGIQGFVESLRTELLHQNSNVKISMVQLPGLNTPQFGWVRTRGLTKHPRPVAPVYAPEVAADAIVWAADHPRRELWVRLPTYYTILGNWFAPGFRTGSWPERPTPVSSPSATFRPTVRTISSSRSTTTRTEGHTASSGRRPRTAAARCGPRCTGVRSRRPPQG